MGLSCDRICPDSNPGLEPLMRDIASYVARLRRETRDSELAAGGDALAEGSQSKKRKLDNLKNEKIEPSSGSTQASLSGEWKSSVRFPDVSFTIPQRKKMTLEIGTAELEGVRAMNAATAAPEGAIAYSEIGKQSGNVFPLAEALQTTACKVPLRPFPKNKHSASPSPKKPRRPTTSW